MEKTTHWYGNNDKEWEERPLWTVLTPRKNKNSEGLVRNLLSLSFGKIVKKDIEICTGLLPESFNSYNIVETGDIVMRLTDLQNDQRSLRTGLVKERGIITSAYLTLIPNINNDPRYLHYLLHSFDIIKGLYNMGEGIRQNLNYDELSRLCLVIPSLSEQSRIASFLDDRCAKIDEAIKRCKEMNGKLDEYRKAVISKAVTKGVRGEREMKESNEVWIGSVPSCWELKKIKYLAKLSGDRANNNDGYLSMENVESWTGRLIETGSSAEGDTLSIIPNQVLFGKLRPYLAKAYLVKNNGCCSGEFLVFNCNQIIASYFRYALTNSSFVERVDVSTYGTKMPRANAVFITNLLFPVPPSEEQFEIVAFLDKRCAEIDTAKEKNEAIVKKFEEYKKSLIYHAVTGKIEY